MLELQSVEGDSTNHGKSLCLKSKNTMQVNRNFTTEGAHNKLIGLNMGLFCLTNIKWITYNIYMQINICRS